MPQQKPSTALTILAGSCAGASETTVTVRPPCHKENLPLLSNPKVPLRIHKNLSPTPSLQKHPHIHNNPHNLLNSRSPRLLRRLLNPRKQQRSKILRPLPNIRLRPILPPHPLRKSRPRFSTTKRNLRSQRRNRGKHRRRDTGRMFENENDPGCGEWWEKGWYVYCY